MLQLEEQAGSCGNFLHRFNAKITKIEITGPATLGGQVKLYLIYIGAATGTTTVAIFATAR